MIDICMRGICIIDVVSVKKLGLKTLSSTKPKMRRSADYKVEISSEIYNLNALLVDFVYQ
jgi:hypothetical protein